MYSMLFSSRYETACCTTGTVTTNSEIVQMTPHLVGGWRHGRVGLTLLAWLQTLHFQTNPNKSHCSLKYSLVIVVELGRGVSCWVGDSLAASTYCAVNCHCQIGELHAVELQWKFCILHWTADCSNRGFTYLVWLCLSRSKRVCLASGVSVLYDSACLVPSLFTSLCLSRSRRESRVWSLCIHVSLLCMTRSVFTSLYDQARVWGLCNELQLLTGGRLPCNYRRLFNNVWLYLPELKHIRVPLSCRARTLGLRDYLYFQLSFLLTFLVFFRDVRIHLVFNSHDLSDARCF